MVSLFMYKAVNGLAPDYIRDIIPTYVRETSPYPLRINNLNNLVIRTIKEILYFFFRVTVELAR